jgi:23S rRNA (cytosine1962-C5)-methyltransferase
MARTDHDPPRRRRRPAGGAPIVRRNTVRLPHDIAWRIRIGHPWVYREAMGPRVLREEPGTTLELVDQDGEFIGRGLYEGEGGLAVRVFTREPDEPIDAAMITRRVVAAIALRKRYFDFDQQQALRLINGEADGLPAIVVERYGDYLVVQLFSAGLLAPLKDALYTALEKVLAPKAIYEQRRFKSLAGDAPRQAAAELVRGQAAPVEFEVREGDLKFWVDVTAPLSTGLFCDLREGRRAVREHARGRRVLNLFSYTGAISVYAAAGGATEVCAVDVAPKAHARARKNFTSSGLPDKAEHLVGDALKVLSRFAERNRKFDLVVIDPPAFASAAARGGKPWSAIKDYAELVQHCLQVTEQNGLLIAASSTHKIGPNDFEAALAEGATQADTQLQVIDRRGLPADFPTLPAFPEGNYLKFVVAVRS